MKPYPNPYVNSENILDHFEYMRQNPPNSHQSSIQSMPQVPSTSPISSPWDSITNYFLTHYFNNDRDVMLRYLIGIGAKLLSSPPSSNPNPSPLAYHSPSFYKGDQAFSQNIPQTPSKSQIPIRQSFSSSSSSSSIYQSMESSTSYSTCSSPTSLESTSPQSYQ